MSAAVMSKSKPPVELRTERLLLRQWRESDLEPFAALNADPEVMRHFPAPLDRAASDAFAQRIRTHLDETGWGLWAVEVVDGDPFIGFVGLAAQTFPAHFTPAVEVGWRLAREHWGHGYAPEAARAALDFAFGPLGLDEVVSMTTPGNVNSQRVMQKLGLTRDPADDFDNPRLPVGHPLRRHILYRIRRPDPAPPETKDWTVVAAAGCPQCGFDPARLRLAEVGARLRATIPGWRQVLARENAHVRPAPQVWAPIEYAGHVRDTCRIFRQRLLLMLEQDDPQFPNWDQDQAAVDARYWAQNPAHMADEFAAEARATAAAFDQVRPEQAERPGRRSDGARFTVTSFATYFLHEIEHHLQDIGGAAK